MEYKSIKGLRYFLFIFFILLILADLVAYIVFTNIIRERGESYRNDRYSTVNSFIETTKKSFDRYSSPIDFINSEQDIIRKTISNKNVFAYYITDSTLFPILVSKSFDFSQKYIRNLFMPILKDNLSMRYFIGDYEAYSFKIENSRGNVLFAVFTFETGGNYINRIMFYFMIYRIAVLVFLLAFMAFLVVSIEKPLSDISKIAHSLKVKIDSNNQRDVVTVFRNAIEEIVRKQKEDSLAMDILNEKYKKMETDYIAREGLLKLSEITNGIAHQLNNQLGGISGLMQAAQKKNEPSLYAEAEAQLKILREFTRKFLEFAGRAKVYYSSVDLKDMILRTSSIHGIEVRGDFEKFTVKSDGHLLEQIFINVFDNISKYTTEKRAEIEVREIPNKIILRITDSGGGYPESVLSNPYNPFSESSSGYGLGIPTVLKLASVMNHTAVFKNENNRGVFEIQFSKEGFD
ncbi:MAG: HAMP domain-containing sensor histidine kinase [bacterium]|nr:HAMP domain-containing sensor histidine kinase [bacterium]